MALGMVRQAFSKEHGRDLTGEEEDRMAAAFGRDDPTDDHLGAVTAEEADACREMTRIYYKTVAKREPTDDELSKRTDTLARCMRRAAIGALRRGAQGRTQHFWYPPTIPRRPTR